MHKEALDSMFNGLRTQLDANATKAVPVRALLVVQTDDGVRHIAYTSGVPSDDLGVITWLATMVAAGVAKGLEPATIKVDQAKQPNLLLVKKPGIITP